MTCIKDTTLTEIPSKADVIELLNEIHAESNEWDAVSDRIRQKYKEKKNLDVDLTIDKPEDFVGFVNEKMKRDSWAFQKFNLQIDKRWDKIDFGIGRTKSFIENKVLGASPGTYTLEQWDTLYRDQEEAINLRGNAAGYNLKEEYAQNVWYELSGISGGAYLDCKVTLEDWLREIYKTEITSYLFVVFYNEVGPLAKEIGWRDFYDAYGDKDKVDELVERLEEEEEEREDLFDDVREALFSDKAIYQEQCFLLSQITSLINFKKEGHLPRLAYTNELVKTKKRKKNDDPFEKVNANAPIMIDDEPFGFLNRLTQGKHSKALFNLPTDKLSSLVPSLKLYKVETDRASGKDLGFVEIKFDTNPGEKSYVGDKSALDLFKSSDKRGIGVGLKGFDFTFHGSDPFAAKKAIQAKMTIFATSFGDLIKDRQGDYKAVSKSFVGKEPISTYKFADLALKTGKTPEDLRKNLSSIQKQNLDKLNFRLKAVFGWANPQSEVLSSEEKSAINDSFVNLNLTPTTHEFSFDEMGGVTFTINYLAYIEDYFNNSNFNIFATPTIESNRIGRKLFYEFMNNENCDSASKEAVKEVDAKIIRAEKTNSLSNLLIEMSNQNKILYYNLTYQQINQFLTKGKIPGGVPDPKVDVALDTQTMRNHYKKAIEAEAPNASDKLISSLQVSLVSTSRDTNKVCFFYVSDLIDVIMQNIDKSLDELISKIKSNKTQALDYFKRASLFGISSTSAANSSFKKFLSSTGDTSNSVFKEIEKLLKSREQFRKLRIVLGPMEVKNPFNESEMTFCSIGDVPISLNYFMEFLTEKMLSKDQAYYPVTNFVKDLTNDLIRNFINNDSCFSFNTKQRVRLNSSVITAFSRNDKGQGGADDLTYFIRDNPTTIGLGKVFNTKYAMAYGLRPVLQIAGPSRDPVNLMQPDREFNYYIFYAGRSYPVQQMTGNEDRDANNGIFHYVLGKDRGIVKNISLERTDMQGLKELRFEQEGYDGLTQLREVYNANIDCFLNPHTFPGTYIYVEPKGFSPEAGINYTQFGIGGYYMITRAEHSIGPGKADTKIVAKWVADSTGVNADSKKAPNVSKEEDKPQKCYSRSRKESISNQRTNSNSVQEIKRRSGGTGFLYGSMGKA